MLRNRLFSVMLVGALGLAGCSAGGAAKFPTAEGALKLERVVLYRNGVGYFERRGALDGEILTIKVRKDQINDLLKSLTVVDKGTGRAVSISMPLDPQTWANAALATLRPGSGDLAQVLDALRGTEVTLRSSEGTVAGRIVMVEELLDSPEVQPRGSMMPPPVSRDHRVTVLDGNEMKVVKLSKVKSIELGDGDLAMQFNRTLDASAGEGMFQQVGVSIRLTGEHSHDLLVSYVVSAPMWKPTYRVVLPAEGKGKALLQAWAVVDNTSGEDWGQVNLGLTSGAPIAFRYDLHTPRDVERSDMTESGVRRQAIAMVGESSFEPLPAPAPPPPTDVAEAEAYDFSDRDGLAGNRTAAKNEAAKGRKSAPFRSRDEAKPSSSVAPMGGAFAAGDAQALEQQQKTIDVESLRRSTLAQARAATVSGQTRFDIDSKVTVPDGTSTMVAIINADVEGEETFLFRPGGAGLGYESNPYRVIRFKNSTPFVLESGPIAIFSGGSFVGEGISDPVGAGTSATIPFAVESDLMVTSTLKDDREEMRLIKISRGVLEVEQFARRTTVYTVKSQTNDKAFSVLVRHPKAGWNYVLASRPEGTEDLADAYLVRLSVAAGTRTGTLSVTEQTPSRSSLSIWDGNALSVLEKLMIATDLNPEARKKLTPLIERRRDLGKLDEQLGGLVERRNKLDQRAYELRENIRAIEKNTQAAAQRQKWTKQLDEFTSEGNKLGAQLAEIEAKRLDARSEIQDLLGELEFESPASK